MIELTPEQSQAIPNGGDPLRVHDPKTDAMYVLVTIERYDRLKAILEGDDESFVRDLYPQTMAVFGREGWDDPAMDIYNDLDPRRQA